MLKSATNYVHIKQSLKQALQGKIEEVKEDQWEISSDELNMSFDSDDDQNSEKKSRTKNIVQPTIKAKQIVNSKKTALEFPEIPSKVEKKSKKLSSYSKEEKKKEEKKIVSKPMVKKSKEEVKKMYAQKGKYERVNRQGRKFKVEVDANVMAIDMKALKDDAAIASGDPVICEGCEAILNVYSKIQINKASGDQIWVCEFCGNKNSIVIDKEEIPMKDTINYVIDKAIEEEKEKKDQSNAIIFCIDVSGSMDQSKTKQDRPIFKIANNPFISLAQDTKLNFIKTAIVSQLQSIKDAENIVGIIAFNDGVNLIGDGTDTKINCVDKEDLKDFSKLCELGKKFAKVRMTESINKTYKLLENSVSFLRGYGKTALGPAAVLAISAAAKLGAGSKVIICTDGLSNVGIGNLQDLSKGKTTQDEIDTFYGNLAELANENGVIIDLISLKCEECDLETLITLSEKTGGDVDILNPDDVRSKLGKLLTKETIATKVNVKIHLHKALEFRNENSAQLNSQKTLLTKKLGSVNEDSEITFEYKFKDLSELKKIKGFDIDELDKVPFQVVIEYTKPDGMKCIRVITQVQKTNDNPEEVLKEVKLEILASNAAKQVAKIARSGKFREAQAYSMNQKKYLAVQANSELQKKIFSSWKGSMNVIYQDIHVQNNIEEVALMKSSAPSKTLSTKTKAPIIAKSKKGYLSKANDMFMNNMNRGMNFNSRAFS